MIRNSVDKFYTGVLNASVRIKKFGANNADIWLVCRINKSLKPAGNRYSIVIQKTEQLTFGGYSTLITSPGKTKVFSISYYLDIGSKTFEKILSAIS